MNSTNQALTQALIKEADRCVACGLCLPYCPTYRKTGSEADSPRGRIQLMRAVAQEILPNNARFQQHIDLCLSCRSCESACPNNVNYGALADATRTLFTPKKQAWFRLAKPFIRHRALSQLLTWPIWALQQLRLLRLLNRVFPVSKRLPTLEKPSAWQPRYPANGIKNGAVSLFLGCASSSLDSATLRASIYVLNQLGYEVHVPPQQTCCGSLARQMGDSAEASTLVETNQSSFAQDMPLLTTASGCGAGLQDYLISHHVQDISAFLMQCDWSNVKLQALPETIYVQDPCTLRNVMQSHKMVYALLNKIPHADIRALPGNSQCCGGAGAYMLTQPAMANTLRDDKLQAIQAANVATLATSNIGCSLHIAEGLRAENQEVNVVHPIQIIAKQMGWREQSE